MYVKFVYYTRGLYIAPWLYEEEEVEEEEEEEEEDTRENVLIAI